MSKNKGYNKRAWTDEEDSLLRSLVPTGHDGLNERDPPLAWDEIAAAMQHAASKMKMNDHGREYNASMVQGRWATLRKRQAEADKGARNGA